MRIGIDARKLGDFGIGRYLSGLLRALAEQAGEHRFTAIVAPGDPAADGLPASIRRLPCAAGKYGLRELLELSFIARREGFELFHAPHFTLPLGLPCPSVVTIHDLIHLRYPEFFGRLRVAGARWLLAHAVRADRIIAVSECTARDLGERLGVAAARVAVIPNGLDPELAAPPDEVSLARVRSLLDFEEPYLLYVGNDKPHKNLPFLLESFARLEGPERLVLAGPDPAGGLAARVAALGLGERVVLPGFFPDAWLPALYREARAFVLPSLYEGFGLPVLEAMAQDAPVLVARTPALLEVAGDAALAADPADAAGFAGALTALLRDEALRERLRAAGRRRVEEFTWKRAARATLAAYAAAAARETRNAPRP